MDGQKIKIPTPKYKKAVRKLTRKRKLPRRSYWFKTRAKGRDEEEGTRRKVNICSLYSNLKRQRKTQTHSAADNPVAVQSILALLL